MDFKTIHILWEETIEDYRLHLEDPSDFCFLRANLFALKLKYYEFKPLIIRTIPNDSGYFVSIPYLSNDSKIKHAKYKFNQHFVCGLQNDADIIVFDPILFDGPELLENWQKQIFKLNYKNLTFIKKYDLIIKDFENCEFINNLSENEFDLLHKVTLEITKPKKCNKIFLPLQSSLNMSR